MSIRHRAKRPFFRPLLATTAMLQLSIFGPLVPSAQAAVDSAAAIPTTTPIKHVILIIGENRTFDHVFATYKPKPGESVLNLLSEGIVNADGSPGPNYSRAVQSSAEDHAADGFQESPGSKTPYTTLPPALAGGPKVAYLAGYPLSAAESIENGLSNDDPNDNYYRYLGTGGTGLTAGTPDTRIHYNGATATTLPPGPFQITSGTNYKGASYDAYTASPVHRFYQMWQQLDCNATYGTPSNPSGCLADLFPWVETTIGAGSNGKAQSAGFTDSSTGEGSTAMGFYNVAHGDAPYLKYLADNYAMSDNYHQAVQGGTGANHIMLGFGDTIWFSDADGNPAVPPHNQIVATGTPNQGTVDEIENPDAAAGTNNWYSEDGYGSGSYGAASSGGGSYSACADSNQPGVGAILNYLKSLPTAVNPNCEPNHYYLLNNYNPGYFGDGSNAYTDTNSKNTVFTIPPTTQKSIADELLGSNVSWAYFGDQWNRYVADKYEQSPIDIYCTICNPFQYETAIMTNAAVRTAHLKDTTDLYADIKNDTLPAVSYVKPSGIVDGHPASSKLDLFEGFVRKIVEEVKANPHLWANTAIFVTFDEGGGYYDSGYVQPVDFFGDGTRIPMIVVSPYTKAGHISHVYGDHVSFLKFVERNWKLQPITGRSRDNLPNPTATDAQPYVPVNSPAIGDLTDVFNFPK